MAKKALIIIVCLLLVFVSLLLYYLFQPREKSPEDVAQIYFRGLFIKPKDPFNFLVENMIYPKVKFQQVGRTITESNASLVYQVEFPDLSKEIQLFLKIVFSGKPQKEITSAIADRLKQIFAEGKYKISQQMVTVNLEKVEGRWRIAKASALKE